MGETKKDMEKRVNRLEGELEKLSEANRKLNERVIELYTLYNVSKSLSLSLQLDELFQTTMNIIGETLNVSDYNLMLLDEATGHLYMQAIHGFEDDSVRKAVLSPGEGIPGKALEKAETLLVEDLSRWKGYVYAENESKLEGSHLCIPLKKPDGTPIGVLSAMKPAKSAFTDTDIRLFEAVAEHVAIAIENARMYQHTKELSNRDELTGVYNRRYFFERLEREVERGKRYNSIFSIVMLDLDHFKRYNDNFGHLSGDRALREVARALEENTRKVDIIARYGGEEFVTILPETDKEDAALVAEKLRRAVEDIKLGASEGGELLTITAGVASFPLDSSEAIDLIEHADKALYTGKAQGRNRVVAARPERQT